jgi:hypothetical protein
MFPSGSGPLSVRVLLLALAVVAVVAGARPLYATRPDPVTDTQAEATQPAGAPVFIAVIMTNTTGLPFNYFWGGPGNYPIAAHYMAQVTDVRGNVQEVRLDNGQYQAGSMGVQQIQPGQSVTMPAALPPLPAGTYTIQVGKGKCARVTVRDDPQLVRKREVDLLERIRKGERFAQRMAAKFVSEFVRDALLQDLLSEDRRVANAAADTLFDFRELPRESATVISKAMRMQLDAEAKRRSPDGGLLTYLAMLAARFDTEETLSAVLALAHSDVDGAPRSRAIDALGAFKQERATRELRGFLKDEDGDIRFEAARALADRKDPAALDVLLAVADDKQSPVRGHAHEALAKFPNDPRVEPALKRALEDDDRFVRFRALQALRELQRVRQPRERQTYPAPPVPPG